MGNELELLAVLDGIQNTNNREFTKIAEAHRTRREQIKRGAMSQISAMKKPMELIRTIREAGTGQHMAMGRLREAVSSGDFPLLFQAVSQASMLGQYADLPQQWPTFSQRTTVPDFRPARMVRWDAGMDAWLMDWKSSGKSPVETASRSLPIARCAPELASRMIRSRSIGRFIVASFANASFLTPARRPRSDSAICSNSPLVVYLIPARALSDSLLIF